jgi:transposase-like protein
MEEPRRNYTPEQKVRILKEHLVDHKAVSDVCDHHGINPVVFYRWQKQFFENGHLALENGKDRHSVQMEKKISRLEQKLIQKNEVLSELMEEHVVLKKSLGES